MLRRRRKPGRDGVAFDVADYAVTLVRVTDPAIERFILPEPVAGSSQQAVGAAGAGALDHQEHVRELFKWIEQNMNVIGHDDPG